MTIVLTGANGMIGGAVLAELMKAARPVRVLSHKTPSIRADLDARRLPSPDAADADFEAALQNASHVIHCAAINNDDKTASQDELIKVNAVLTGKLAKAAFSVVPGRFVYISSIRAVAGAEWSGIIDETTTPMPACAYGRSKLAGEQVIRDIYRRAAGNRAVILRLAPVYGVAMRGSMRTLLKLANTAWPLPVAALNAPRSLLSLQAAVGAAMVAIEREQITRGDYVVADRAAVSIADTLHSFRSGLSRPDRTFSIPPALFSAAAAVLGKRTAWNRIAASQICDPSALEQIGWQAETDSRKALAALAHDFRKGLS